MKRRAFLGLGATSIGVGALYGTGAFSSVSAGRGVSVNASDDADALLGIEGTGADTTPKFTNNTDTGSMGIELDSGDNIEFDVNGDGEFEEPPVSFSIDAGASQQVELDGNDNEADVAVSADLINSDGTVVGRISLNRVFEIPQVATIKEIVGTVKQSGGSGKYEFSLTNESDKTVTIDGFGIDWTNPSAEKVGGKKNDQILERNGTQIIDEVITVGGTIVDVIGGEEVTLAGGDQADFDFDRFRDDQDDNFGVDDVDLNVRAEDGSTATVELRT